MATTKKAAQIQAKKIEQRKRIESVAQEIRSACNIVPAAVLVGDAIIAQQWKAAAERGISVDGSCGRSLSLADLEGKAVKLEQMLGYLRNPSRDAVPAS